MSPSLYILILVSIFFASAQSLNSTLSPGPYSNDSDVQFCGACDIVGADENNMYFPYGQTYTATFITELVTSDQNGPVTLTVNDTKASDAFSSSMAGLTSFLFASSDLRAGPVDAAMASSASVEFGISYVIYSTVSIANGTKTCAPTELVVNYNGEYTTTLDTPISDRGEFCDNPLPSSYLSSIGLILPVNCKQDFPGGAVAQIPVTYITSTSTVNHVSTWTTSTGLHSPLFTTSHISQSIIPSPGPTPPPVSPTTTTSNSRGKPSASVIETSSGRSKSKQTASSTPTHGPDPSSSSLRPSLQSPLSLEVFASTPSNSVLAVGTQTLIIGETSSTFTSTMISLISSTTTTASGTSVSTGDHGSAPALPPATTLDRSSHADDLDSTSMITSQTLNLSDEMTTAKTGDSTVSSVDAATVESITFNTETSGKSHITSNIAFDSSSFTIAPMSDVAITRQTISPNGESTTDAPVISSATSDTAIAISTFAVSTSSTSSTSSTPGLGGIVYSMFNGEGGSTTDGPSPTTGADGSSNSTIFTGNAQRPRLPLRLGVTMIALLMLGRKFLVKIA